MAFHPVESFHVHACIRPSFLFIADLAVNCEHAPRGHLEAGAPGELAAGPGTDHVSRPGLPRRTWATEQAGHTGVPCGFGTPCNRQSWPFSPCLWASPLTVVCGRTRPADLRRQALCPLLQPAVGQGLCSGHFLTNTELDHTASTPA